MEPTKSEIPKPSIRPPAKLPEKHPSPSAKLTKIQFGILSSKANVNLSVIREKDEKTDKVVGITKCQDLFDARLGVPNKDLKCATCNGTRRGDCDSPNSCDGHFGHIALPVKIYHPHFIRKCLKILSSVCLGCSRVLEKKTRKNILDAVFEETSGDNGEGNSTFERSARKRKAGAAAIGDGTGERRRTQKGKHFVLTNFMDSFAGGMKQEMEDEGGVGLQQVGGCKEEPIEVADLSLPGCGLQTPRPVPKTPRPSNDGQQVPGPCSDDQPLFCKYCGGPDGVGSKYPKLKLKVVSKQVGRRGRIDTIKLVVDEKAGVLPSDFWRFVDGHPINDQEKIRTLLPFEAWNILRRIPEDGIVKLHMDKLVSRPEDLVLRETLVSPNCNRVAMENWSSRVLPNVLLRTGPTISKLEALVRTSTKIGAGKGSVKDEFADVEQESEELQLLAARHFRACKVVEYKMITDQEIEETGGILESKWLKANVLAKRSNHSARTVINGDPRIMIGEIGIPEEIAHRLTVEEEVNSLNMRKWQMHLNNYMFADNLSMPGAFALKKKKDTGQKDLSRIRAKMQGNDRQTLNRETWKVEVGDTITRCLKDGDYVLANRPPSLHKHSLIALKVKVHPLSTFAINPLICPPFDADFDGDAFHIFVPQSLECKAELQELMSATAQIICPQGGQPLIGLTQDSLVGGHLLTSRHVFISKTDMQQLSMWCSSKLPVPAIVKSPDQNGPLWTGKQLFSMTLPEGLNFGKLFWTGQQSGMTAPTRPGHSPEGEVLVWNGEVLVSQGGAKWLERSTNGIVRAVCDHAGPVATMEHLNCLQAVVHQWLLIRGFSVGLMDYHAGQDANARTKMLEGVQKSLQNANEASLKQALRLDREVQHKILHPVQRGTSRPVDEEHEGCFGLLLGDRRGSQRVTALQGAAIERFQALAPNIENLVTGYMAEHNSLLAMVRSGSKGSMSKLTQQSGCLGLQLFKGERLLPLRSSNKLSYFQTSSTKLDVFCPSKEDSRSVGYWESRGIIRSSYLDGLNPLEFFIDSTASRCNVMRQGIEEPNQILKSLMLFMRDMHIAYDGTVRNRGVQTIIQFQYGGAKECLSDKDPKRAVPACPLSKLSQVIDGHWANSKLAGEPVGVIAATSIAEPAYNVRMQSIHQAQLLGAGPVQLLKETLLARSKTKLKLNDRRFILRLPHGFGKEQRALEVQEKLQKITLEMITLTVAIEYRALDDKPFVKDEIDNGVLSSKLYIRISPWTGHLLLCKRTVDENKLNIHTIVDKLNKVHSGKVMEDSHGIFFSYSKMCLSKVHEEKKGLCIWFFSVIPRDRVCAPTREAYPEKMALLLESMKTIMLPTALNTTIKGFDGIERVRIIWEDSGSASRILGETTSIGQPSIYQAKRPDPGELVIEVTVKASKGAGKRGAAWLTVKEACVLVMDLIDWRRSSPYSVQEIHQSYGVEAARHSIVKRLTLATRNMGKPVLHDHLTLVADTMTHCGDVIGLGSAGYRDFCSHLSISTPFTEAAFQQPKKTFIDAAARGASEIIDGVLPTSVWGSRTPLGTGLACQIKAATPKAKGQTWPVDPLDLWGQIKASEAVDRKQTSSLNRHKDSRHKQRMNSAISFLAGERIGCKRMLERKENMQRSTAYQNAKQEGSKCRTEKVEEMKRAIVADKDDRKTGVERKRAMSDENDRKTGVGVDKRKRAIAEEDDRKTEVEETKRTIAHEDDRKTGVEERKRAVTDENCRKTGAEERKRPIIDEDDRKRGVEERKRAIADKDVLTTGVEESKTVIADEDDSKSEGEESKIAITDEDVITTGVEKSETATTDENYRKTDVEESKTAIADEDVRKTRVEETKRAITEEDVKKAGVEEIKTAIAAEDDRKTGVEETKIAIVDKHHQKTRVEEIKTAIAEEDDRKTGVEERKRAIVLEDDRKTGCKRFLERVEETEICDKLVSKLHKKHASHGPSRIETDPTILRANDPRRVTWSIPGHSDAALGQDMTTKVPNENMDVDNELSHGEDLQESAPLNCVDGAITGVTPHVPASSTDNSSWKGADDTSVVSHGEALQESVPLNCVDGAITRVTGHVPASSTDNISRKAADDTSLVSSCKPSWFGVKKGVQKFMNLFNPSSRNDHGHDPEMEKYLGDFHLAKGEAEKIGSMRKALHHDDNLDPQKMHFTSAINGSIGPTQLAAITVSKPRKLYEMELNNLLHVRYRVGERVQGDVEKMLLNEVLVHHPQQAEKIGCGVDYFKRTDSDDSTKWKEDQQLWTKRVVVTTCA